MLTRTLAISLLIGAALMTACDKKDGASAPPEKSNQGDPVASTAPSSEASEPVGIVNGAFEAEGQGVPGWTLQVGANNDAAGGKSTARVVDSGDEQRGRVLEMRGDAAVSTWHMVTQQFPVTGQRAQVRVTFWERAIGLTREGMQHNNANMVVMLADAQGKRLGIHGTTPLNGDVAWSAGRLNVTAPAGVAKVTVAAFSSQSGRYQVDDVDVLIRDLKPWSSGMSGEAWDFFTAEVASTYPFDPFEASLKAWNDRAAKLRPQAVAANNRDGFIEALKALLAPLKDPHVGLKIHGKPVAVAPLVTLPKMWNFEALTPLVAEQLLSVRNFGAVRLKNGLGYIVIGSWLQQGFPLAELSAAMDKLKDAPGIIIDVRTNMGGNEALAMQIAGRFTSKPIVYAKHRYRAGEGFGRWIERTLRPSSATPFGGKVAVLQSKWCMSSNEGFLAMARAVPNVTTVGYPSRGASSDPAPIGVTADIDVVSSRWQSALPDGTLIEHRGIEPQVLVTAPISAFAKADPVVEAAFKLLLPATK